MTPLYPVAFRHSVAFSSFLLYLQHGFLTSLRDIVTLLRLPAVLHFLYGSVSSLCPHWFRAQEIVATDDLRRVDLAGH